VGLNVAFNVLSHVSSITMQDRHHNM